MTRRWLEAFKFTCYLSLPVFLTVVVAGTPQNLATIIKNRSYVVYPPEAEGLPSSDEIMDMVKKNREDRK